MFLLIKGAKAGLIKGESQDDVHAGEIDVVSWSWGLEAAPVYMGGGQVYQAFCRQVEEEGYASFLSGQPATAR